VFSSTNCDYVFSSTNQCSLAHLIGVHIIATRSRYFYRWMWWGRRTPYTGTRRLVIVTFLLLTAHVTFQRLPYSPLRTLPMDSGGWMLCGGMALVTLSTCLTNWLIQETVSPSVTFMPTAFNRRLIKASLLSLGFQRGLGGERGGLQREREEGGFHSRAVTHRGAGDYPPPTALKPDAPALVWGVGVRDPPPVMRGETAGVAGAAGAHFSAGALVANFNAL
jgi:hypothetical protein